MIIKCNYGFLLMFNYYFVQKHFYIYYIQQSLLSKARLVLDI